MNTYFSFIAVIMVGLLGASAATPLSAAPFESGLVARIHFAGGDHVAADTNYGPLKPVWSSPEAMSLRSQTLDKLDRFLDVWLRQQIAPGLAAIQVRPLLADLYTAEWQLEARQPVGDTAEFSLAARLNDAQAQTWVATLTPVVEGWKRNSPAHHGQIVRTGPWVVFQLGNSPTAAPAPEVKPFKSVWMAIDVDWTRLAVWFPGVAELKLPQTRMELTGRSGAIQMVAKLSLSHPLSTLPAWQYPTNFMSPSILSFTAARGISDYLQQQPWVEALNVNPLPDELFTWAGGQGPFGIFAAMPLASAPAVLPRLQSSLANDMDIFQPPWMAQRLALTLTNNEVSLTGLPWIAPYIEAVHSTSGEYLLGGLMPHLGRGKGMPPELVGALQQSGVVYFHWESSGPRLNLYPQLYQLLFVLTGHRQLDAKSAAGVWLSHLEPLLRPSITKVTEDSPTELTLTRQATTGLTAFELVALGSWLEAPNFPGCDLRVPPPHRPLPHPAKPGATPIPIHH